MAARNPHNDIALIGGALEKLGFKTSLVQDADYRAIDVAVKRHIQSVRREGGRDDQLRPLLGAWRR